MQIPPRSDENNLLALVYGGDVLFFYDSPIIHDLAIVGNGESIYRVSQEGTAITIEATQWYSSEGEFSVTISFLSAERAVLLADKLAQEAVKEI